eukprot:479996-Amphidinium_carterae.3
MAVETGIFIEGEPQMWHPPSTHHQGYVQERHQFSHCPGHDQLQGQVFMMAPPEPRPMTHDIGLHMPHTTHGATDRLRIIPQPKVAQGAPDPFDFQNQGGVQGGGNYVNLAANKANDQCSHPQPREASSIELPELPTPPKFRSWRSAVRRVVVAASTQPQFAFQWLLEVEGMKPSSLSARSTLWLDHSLSAWVNTAGITASRSHLNEFTASTMLNTRSMSQTFCNWCDQNSLTGVLNKFLEADGTIKPQYATADNGVEHDHKQAMALHRWHRDNQMVLNNQLMTMRIHNAGTGTELQWRSPLTILHSSITMTIENER